MFVCTMFFYVLFIKNNNNENKNKNSNNNNKSDNGL